MDINPVKGIEITRVSFNDVDQFSDWENAQGWQVESSQLSAGTNKIRFDHFAFPEMLVGRYTLKQSMHNIFALPDGMVLFLIARAKLPVIWNGKHFPPTLMGVVRSGLEHCDVMPAGWDCYEFIVTENLVWQTELFPADFFARTTRFEHAYLPLLEPVTTQFLQVMDSFFQLSRNTRSSSPISVERSELFDYIINGLLQVIDTGLQASGSLNPKRVRRPDLVSRAIDIVATRIESHISIVDLAQSLKVSNRVLNYAFKDTLGISPKQYILNQKLHSTRRMLKSTNATVSEAYSSYGFTTPGRFATQYKRLFGELPSETRYSSVRLKV